MSLEEHMWMNPHPKKQSPRGWKNRAPKEIRLAKAEKNLQRRLKK